MNLKKLKHSRAKAKKGSFSFRDLLRQIGRHPVAIPLGTFTVLFLLTVVGFLLFGVQTIGANNARVVHLVIDDKEQVIPTHAPTVQELLARLHIEVGPQDIIEPALATEISDTNFRISLYRARSVLVEDEGSKKIIITAEPSPEGVIKSAGLTVYPEDRVSRLPVMIDPVEVLQEGIVTERFVVNRATLVHLNLYGNPFSTRTHAATVDELLTEKEIKPLPEDTVQPSPSTPIQENLQIFILTKGKQIESREEQIDPPLERREDPGADIGVTVVVEPGAPGKRVVTYEIELENGKEVRRREIQSVIIQQPAKRIVRIGTKKKTFSGSFEAALAALRSCEGSYTSNTGNGYYGAYQYDIGTWNNFAGYPNAAAAPPYVQDQKAWETYQRRGWSPWPSCSKKLGLQDSYR